VLATPDESSGGHRPGAWVGRVFHSGLPVEVVQLGPFLTLWVVYGFCAGHLAGLLFRKSLVAVVVGFGGAVLLASVWVPSLCGGGLHGWQVWGVPLLLLATSRLLLRAWAAGRLGSRGPVTGLVAAAACALWDAGGLWYRVEEVPLASDRFDMPAFIASL